MRFRLAPRQVVILAVCAVPLAGCDATGPAFAPTREPVTLAVPNRTNENVALSSAGRLLVATWSAASDLNSEDIYAAVSRDEGTTFGAAVRVNTVDGDARVNGEQPPRSVLIDRPGLDSEILVIWTTSIGGAMSLAGARSVDGGRTFQPTELPDGVNGQGNRGWEQVRAVDGGRRVDAVWLDHRRLAPPPGSAKAAHKHDHSRAAAPADMDMVEMAQLSDLYFASLLGGLGPRAVTPGVCYCCKTAMAHGPDGAIYLAWRHVYAGDLRDIAFTVSRDGGATFSSPVRVHEDNWALRGCPDDGPSMAADATGRLHIVWPTMVGLGPTAIKTVRYSQTGDGRTFSTPVALPSEGHAHHPQIAVAADGSLGVVWDETRDHGRVVARARGIVDSSGQPTFTRDPAAGAPAGVYPTLIPIGTGFATAWTATEPNAPTVIRITRW